jgi:hypothetical protein
MEHLLAKMDIGGGARRTEIIVDDRGAVAGGLAESDGAMNACAEDFPVKGGFKLVEDLEGQTCAGIEERDGDPEQLKVWISGTSDPLNDAENIT